MLNNKNLTKIIEINLQNENDISMEIIEDFKFKLKENDPDLMIVDLEEKESIGIETVKKIKSWAYIRPFSSQKKVIIIKKGDRMTNEAQNAILKITEEPPVFTYIYILVENHKNLLQTIISRAEVITRKDTPSFTESLAEKFLTSDIASKFKLCDELALKKKEEINNFIDELIIKLKEKMDTTKILEALFEYKNALNKNVNKKLILDNIALDLNSIV